ncbi:hypothetical protein AYO41_01250 [Verrucomicrobia bacterium SCGC AG-212-E04]|nr:hypothetical protein AYO41_01250 [Verrucomicrobia bacterium SCGC AG-212-E04]
MKSYHHQIAVGLAVVLIPLADASAQNVAKTSSEPTASQAAKPPDYGELIAAKKVSPIYPFQVKVGGQLAFIEGNPQTAIFAKLKEPVGADAEIEILGVPAMIIINVFKVNPDGSVTSSESPKIIMVQNGIKTRLDETMDKSKLPPGLYGMNIVYANVTSRVMFTVK